VQIGLSIAGIVARHHFGDAAFANVGEILGWTVWGGAALLAAGALVSGVLLLFGVGRRFARSAYVLFSPFLLFALLVGAGLWITAATDFSKFHLLWITPLAILLSAFFGLGAVLRESRRLGKVLASELKGRMEMLQALVQSEKDRRRDSPP
jgi:hypothetical protein